MPESNPRPMGQNNKYILQTFHNIHFPTDHFHNWRLGNLSGASRLANRGGGGLGRLSDSANPDPVESGLVPGPTRYPARPGPAPDRARHLVRSGTRLRAGLGQPSPHWPWPAGWRSAWHLSRSDLAQQSAALFPCPSSL